MSISQTVSETLSRPVSRKQFLKQVGALSLAVIGVAAIIRALEKTDHESSGGYGKSPYGG